MKRLLVIALAMVLALAIAGQSWAAKAPKPPKPTKDSFVKLVSAELLPDFRWKYVLKLKKAAKNNSRPFVVGEFNNWQAQDLTLAPKTKKYYRAEIITFNREIKFNYGGWYDEKLPPEKWSWAPIHKSKFYDKNEKVLVVGFYNGKLYKKGLAPFAPPPGQFGDDVVRFDQDGGDQTTLYFNNAKVSGSLANPFFTANLRKWSIESQQISNSDGWGSVTFKKFEPPLTLDFTFGGDYEDDSWAVISGSKYYYVDPEGHQFLRVCFHRDQEKVAQAVASDITVGACKEIIKVEPIKLISRQRLDDFRWRYKFGLRKYAIISERLFPVIIADVLDNWKVNSLTTEDSDGYYELTVESFNREISLNYADSHNESDQSKWTWADLQNSAFWDEEAKTIVIGLYEGEAFTKGKAPFTVPPGAGDDFLRFSLGLDGKTLTVYFNNNKVNGSVKQPARRWNLDRWALGSQRIEDSSGWGKAEIEVGLPVTIDATYSGDEANSSVSNIKDSKFFFKDEATGDEFFRVCIQ